MKLFKCTHCGQLIYFENERCEQCGYPLGFKPDCLALLPLVKKEKNTFALYGEDEAGLYQYCANHQHRVCNWLVPAGSDNGFCPACSLNRTIPDLSQPDHRRRWQKIESAKHRLVYSLLRLGLSLVSKLQHPESGLVFDFRADEKSDENKKVLTGHDNGLITLNIAEADDIEREMARKAMDEVYRTLLGHFRHEVGHYYWDRLIDHSVYLDEYRLLFGDERKDYGEALKVHYNAGAPVGWQQHFISAYATAHPWEDWAETWAHYLHIMDTLETAYAFGVSVHPALAGHSASYEADVSVDPYEIPDFITIINLWLPVTFAMNSLNRSMGQQDVYPFVIPPKVIEKLNFIHKVCRTAPCSPVGIYV